MKKAKTPFHTHTYTQRGQIGKHERNEERHKCKMKHLSTHRLITFGHQCKFQNELDINFAQRRVSLLSHFEAQRGLLQVLER